MRLDIDLTPDQECALARKAARLSLDVDTYLHRLIERAARPRRAPLGVVLPPPATSTPHAVAWTDEDLHDLASDMVGRSAVVRRS